MSSPSGLDFFMPGCTTWLRAVCRSIQRKRRRLQGLNYDACCRGLSRYRFLFFINPINTWVHNGEIQKWN